MPIGNILARSRLGRDMQQKDLAAALGVARSTVSAWEKGHRTPDADQVRELCRLLHVSADVLLERAPFELLAMPAKETQ